MSMTIDTSCHPYLILHGANIDQVSEHRRLRIANDNIVDIGTRKLIFNAHVKPHTDYASIVWDGYRDVLKKD